MKVTQSYMIGSCRILPVEYAISYASDQVESLQPKFIEVLNYLAINYPRIIERDELIEKVWNGNVYVGEKALTNTIWHLRQHLKQACTDEEIIGTVRKVGYRLLIEPQWLESDPDINKTHQNQLNAATTVDHTNTSIPQLPFVKRNHRQLFKFIVIFSAFIVLFFSAYYFFPSKDNKIASPAKNINNITQMTTYPGSELFATPSPDGRYFAFNWLKTDGSHDLYLQDSHNLSQPAKRLTNDDAYENLSTWGEHGEYLYFARRNKEKAQCEIIKKNVITNEEYSLAQCSTSTNFSFVDISPDGNTLAFYGYQAPSDNSGVYFLSLTEPNAKPVRFSCSNNCGYKERDVAFSPDGKHIAVTRRVNRFNENIYLVNIADKSSIPLTSGEEDIVGLTWHPSGKKLVYATQQADIRQGYVLNIDTMQRDEIKISGFSYPKFAKKSGELYFQQRKEQYYISSLTLNNQLLSSPFPVVQSAFNHHFPDYSPVTKKLAYVSNESGNYELWWSNSDGSQAKQLTNLNQNIHYPKWSHDGKNIAFLAPAADHKSDHIYILNIDSQKLVQLKTPFIRHNRPTWSFDDKNIISAIYAKDHTDIYSFALDSTHYQRLTDDGGRYGLLIDKNTLLYTKLEDGLWRKDISDDNLPVNVIPGKEFLTLFSWNYQQNGVYFRKYEQDYLEIKFFDFANNSITPLVRLPNKTFESYGALTFVPEKNQLLFTSSLYPQSDIKKLKNSALFN